MTITSSLLARLGVHRSYVCLHFMASYLFLFFQAAKCHLENKTAYLQPPYTLTGSVVAKVHTMSINVIDPLHIVNTISAA